MIYVVSGYRRSGTSCVMRALHEGGLPAIYQPRQERLSVPSKEYNPNPSGLLEAGQQFYMQPVFLRKIPDDSLIKILFDGLPILPAGEYKIIFMLRNEDEIRASCERVDRHLRLQGVPESAAKGYPFDSFKPYNQEDIDHVIEICEMRADIDLIKIQFRDVIEQPKSTFRHLQRRGVPVDIDKASAVIDPQHYRFRNGNPGSLAKEDCR